VRVKRKPPLVLFGVRSERQQVRDVAYRWFLRLSLTDAVFDASHLSQNCRRRFKRYGGLAGKKK
jgi:hypothetical protein